MKNEKASDYSVGEIAEFHIEEEPYVRVEIVEILDEHMLRFKFLEDYDVSGFSYTAGEEARDLVRYFKKIQGIQIIGDEFEYLKKEPDSYPELSALDFFRKVMG